MKIEGVAVRLVEVNGVKLTREQIEDALKRINDPETFVPLPGERVKFSGSFYKVLDLERASESVKWATVHNGVLLYHEGEGRVTWQSRPLTAQNWEKIDG